MKQKFALGCIVVALLAIAPKTAFGDDDNEGDGGKKKKKPLAPLDGGLSILAISGIGYGISKMKNKKKGTGKNMRYN